MHNFRNYRLYQVIENSTGSSVGTPWAVSFECVQCMIWDKRIGGSLESLIKRIIDDSKTKEEGLDNNRTRT